MRVIWKVGAILFLLAQWELPLRAQRVVEPGDGVVMAVADDCATSESAPVWISPTTRCSAASATAGAAWSVGSFNDIGNPRAAAAVFNTFRVTDTPETRGRFVGAWIGYEVAWKGFLSGASIGFSDANVEVTYELMDLTTQKVINSGLIWGRSTDGFAFSVEFVPIEIAAHTDQGVANQGVPAILVRGHTYRFLIRLTCSGRLRGESGGFTCDYEDESSGHGLTWRRLEVKLGADDRQISDRLNLLESEIEALKKVIEQLKIHTHEYLTGAGVGHNNRTATSGPPKF